MLLFIAILVREIIFQQSVHMQLLMVLKCTHAIDIVNNIEINPKESSVGSAGCLHSDRVSRTDAFYNTSPVKYFINELMQFKRLLIRIIKEYISKWRSQIYLALVMFATPFSIVNLFINKRCAKNTKSNNHYLLYVS